MSLHVIVEFCLCDMHKHEFCLCDMNKPEFCLCDMDKPEFCLCDMHKPEFCVCDMVTLLCMLIFMRNLRFYDFVLGKPSQGNFPVLKLVALYCNLLLKSMKVYHKSFKVAFVWSSICK